MSEPTPALADGDHYREMAGRLRALPRDTRSPGIHRELVEFVGRSDQRGDYVDTRSARIMAGGFNWFSKRYRTIAPATSPGLHCFARPACQPRREIASAGRNKNT